VCGEAGGQPAALKLILAGWGWVTNTPGGVSGGAGGQLAGLELSLAGVGCWVRDAPGGGVLRGVTLCLVW